MKQKSTDLAARFLAIQSRLIQRLLPRLSPAAVLPGVALFAAACLAAWILTDIFWVFSAPLPKAFYSGQMTDADKAGRAVSQRHLMGTASAGEGAKGAGAANANIVVFGVVSSVRGQPGFAVLSLNGQPPRGVVEGEELSPGVRLEHVAADHIETIASGVRQKLALAPRQMQQTARLQNGQRPAPATDEKTTPPEHVGGQQD